MNNPFCRCMLAATVITDSTPNAAIRPRKADDQAEAAEEFRREGEQRQRRRDPHFGGECVERRTESVAAEPAQDLLRAVRKHHRAERDPEDRQ